MHKTLKNWRGKRAGGRITVYGEDSVTSSPDKIVGVDVITPSAEHPGCCLAIDKHGVTHYLQPKN